MLAIQSPNSSRITECSGSQLVSYWEWQSLSLDNLAMMSPNWQVQQLTFLFKWMMNNKSKLVWMFSGHTCLCWKYSIIEVIIEHDRQQRERERQTLCFSTQSETKRNVGHLTTLLFKSYRVLWTSTRHLQLQSRHKERISEYNPWIEIYYQLSFTDGLRYCNVLACGIHILNNVSVHTYQQIPSMKLTIQEIFVWWALSEQPSW